MEGVSTFLESSTIHGLTYISTTRKYVRIFWILVVITGFVGASLLIKESFDSWSESPVKTIIDTLPISEIKFPKVTVCPPKKTFTDLNYDLIMTEKMNLTNEMRDEMFKVAFEVINQDRCFQTDWNKLNEQDRSYNWYHGYTEIGSQYKGFDGYPEIQMNTGATSGVVSTQHYGEQFIPDLVERNLMYYVNVYTPESVRDNENVTKHFKVEKVSMNGLSGRSQDTVSMKVSNNAIYLDAKKIFEYRNVTPPRIYYGYTSLYRRVSSSDFEQVKLNVMPGFRFSWWYTGAEVTPDHKYKDRERTKLFVRYKTKYISQYCHYDLTYSD